MGYTVDKLLDIARSQIGYKEKASNSQLDDFDANAGSNNWTKYARDLYTAGLEYGFMKYFMLRASYTYEEALTESIFDENGSTSLMSGFACGASVVAPLSKAKNGKNGIDISFDYSFRATKVMGGIHSIGASLAL